ncbi:MAG: glycosyltransferase family 4 protein [Verrucomicrobiota bacterium]
MHGPDAMLKVTFCAYDCADNVGGPVAWIQRLLPALRLQGIACRCLFLTYGPSPSGPTLSALRAEGFECPSTVYQQYTEDRARWLLAQLSENPPDVFVPSLVLAGYFAARWVRRAGIPTVGILHSDDDYYRGLQKEFVFGRREFRVSGLVCVSRELEQQVLLARPRGTAVRRIPYGVPVPPAPVERRTTGLRLAYVGRLVEEQKRISELTRALCRVVRGVPGTEAVMYGDGPDRTNVENVLAVEGAGLPVRLAGRVESDQIQQQLFECQVIVLLSDYEGLPIALMEGMACGCVPVCLRMRSGIPELIEDGVTGILVDDRADSFINAIRRLRREPGLWERLSRAARARILTEYSNGSSVKQWAELLRQLHEHSGPRGAIHIPGRMHLPPVNPAFGSADVREIRPSLPICIYRRGRMFAGRVRRRLLGRPIP